MTGGGIEVEGVDALYGCETFTFLHSAHVVKRRFIGGSERLTSSWSKMSKNAFLRDG